MVNVEDSAGLLDRFFLDFMQFATQESAVSFVSAFVLFLTTVYFLNSIVFTQINACHTLLKLLMNTKYM